MILKPAAERQGYDKQTDKWTQTMREKHRRNLNLLWK